MAKSTTKDYYEQHRIKTTAPCDNFCIRYGYKDRNSVTIRFHEDKQEIYLSDWNEARGFQEDKYVSATVSFDLFVKKLPDFIKYLESQQGELNV